MKDCFVIMPFSTSESHSEEEWTEVFEELFKPAWQAFGIQCHRTRVPRGSITKDIIEKLYSASIVFADLTDSNPNVMYELGVRHAFRKPSVMVKEEGSVIPFDVNDYNVFEYEYTPKGLEELKSHIKMVIEDVETFPNKGDNPVWDFSQTSDFITDYYRTKETVQKLEALREELEGNLKRCDTVLGEIDNIEKMKKPTEEQKARMVSNFLPGIRSDALTLLRTTRYTEFTTEDWDLLSSLNTFYVECQCLSSNLGMITWYENARQDIEARRKEIAQVIGIIVGRIAEIESQ